MDDIWLITHGGGAGHVSLVEHARQDPVKYTEGKETAGKKMPEPTPADGSGAVLIENVDRGLIDGLVVVGRSRLQKLEVSPRLRSLGVAAAAGSSRVHGCVFREVIDGLQGPPDRLLQVYIMGMGAGRNLNSFV